MTRALLEEVRAKVLASYQRKTHCVGCGKKHEWISDEPMCAWCAGKRDALTAIAAAKNARLASASEKEG